MCGNYISSFLHNRLNFAIISDFKRKQQLMRNIKYVNVFYNALYFFFFKEIYLFIYVYVINFWNRRSEWLKSVLRCIIGTHI